eukprot:SAG31_NODE_32990_length_349_cov_0.828000_1_plen_70_part_01
MNTTHAKTGDKGSEVLPKTPTNTVWSAGMSYEVSWTIEANHGGGCVTPWSRTVPLATDLCPLLLSSIPIY